MRSEPRWHYHATLTCGCRIRFDLPDNVFLMQVENDPEAEGVRLHVRCTTHNTMVHTKNLAVTTADTTCHACKIAGHRARKGKVAPWTP